MKRSIGSALAAVVMALLAGMALLPEADAQSVNPVIPGKAAPNKLVFALVPHPD